MTTRKAESLKVERSAISDIDAAECIFIDGAGFVTMDRPLNLGNGKNLNAELTPHFEGLFL